MPDQLLAPGGANRAAVLGSLCGYVTAGRDGRIGEVNETFLAWSGHARADVVGQRRFEDFLTPAGRIFYQGHACVMLRNRGIVREVALQLVARDGSRLPVLVNIAQRRDAAGEVVATAFTVFNASERTRYEEELLKARRHAEQSHEQLLELNGRLSDSNAALHAQGERLRVTLNAIGDGVIATDVAGRVSYMNPAAATLCGHAAARSAGLPLGEVFVPFDEHTGLPFSIADAPCGELAALAREGKWVLRKDNAQIPVTLVATPMHDEAGTIVGLLVVFRDVSAAREYEARLHDLATHDALTGLINRHEFERRLALALREGAQDGHTLMYLDLDQFKIVNDTCGHAAGDELMRQVAHIMRTALRREDTLARLGGDEFGVLLHRRVPGEALAVAERLRQTVREFDFVWDGKLFPIGVSIGAVHLAAGAMDLDDALRLADSACYVAKGKGRNRIHVGARDDLEVERHKGEVGWISRLHLALKEARFVLFGQQIVPVEPKPGQPRHVEVLIRMRDEEGRLVSPMAFIPAAERYGLMPEIDRWVVGTVLERFHALASGSDTIYAVNLSGATLCDEGFLSFARAAFARSKLPPARICFEITETAAIANLKQATRLIDELKALGCQFALDDFGSGMSSFGYLRHLPVDFLKIDGRFVKDLLADRVNYAMVEAINRVGQVMGLQTIAEFVEDAPTLEALRGIGIDFAQGYGVHKPEKLYPA